MVEQNYAFMQYLSKTKQELDKAISERDSKKIFNLSNELGISYDENDPVKEAYEEGYKWVSQENNLESELDIGCIDDVILKEEKSMSSPKFNSKQDRVKSFLKRGNALYGVREGYESAKVQANLLATHFPGKFNSPGKLTKTKEPREIKTIYQILDENPRKVSEMYNNLYNFYLNKK